MYSGGLPEIEEVVKQLVTLEKEISRLNEDLEDKQNYLNILVRGYTYDNGNTAALKQALKQLHRTHSK